MNVEPLLKSTKKVFASYCNSKKVIEKLKFHEYFSKFGIVSELVVHTLPKLKFLSNSEASTSSNDLFTGFVIIHYVDVESVEKCFGNGGTVHTIDGEIVCFRRIVSRESVVKRKRELFIEDYKNSQDAQS